MDIEVISKKLFIISSIFSTVILTIIYISTQLNSTLYLSYCNSNSKINILIQSENIDILINPIGIKEAFECLGKHMPYYDRTIEVVLTEDENMLSLLRKRYKVDNNLRLNTITFKNLIVTIENGVLFQGKDNKLLKIYQRPLISIDPYLLTGQIDSIIRPEINESSHFIKEINARDYRIKEGSFRLKLLSF